MQRKRVGESLKRSDGDLMEVANISPQPLELEALLSTVSHLSDRCRTAAPSCSESKFELLTEEGERQIKRLRQEISELNERINDYKRV